MQILNKDLLLKFQKHIVIPIYHNIEYTACHYFDIIEPIIVDNDSSKFYLYGKATESNIELILNNHIKGLLFRDDNDKIYYLPIKNIENTNKINLTTFELILNTSNKIYDSTEYNFYDATNSDKTKLLNLPN